MTNPNISRDLTFGESTPLGADRAQIVVLGDQANSNLLRTVDAGVSDGTSFLGGAVTLYALAGAAQATSGSQAFSTAGLTLLAVDITITSFTGGTTPTIVFNLDRLGADGVWYNVWPGNTTGQAQGASGLPVAFSVDVVPSGGTSWSPPNGTQHGVLTTQARFRWTTTGSPTAVTFSVSIVGRP